MSGISRPLSRGLAIVALSGMAVFGGGYATNAATHSADSPASHTLNETINQMFLGSNFPLSIVLTVQAGQLRGTNGQDPTEGCTFNAKGNVGPSATIEVKFVSGPCTGTITTFTGQFNGRTGNGRGTWTNTVGNSGTWTSSASGSAAAPASGPALPNVH